MVLPLDWEPSAEDPFTFQGDCCSSREGGRTRDELDDTLFATFAPPSRKDRTFSALLQDKLDLRAADAVGRRVAGRAHHVEFGEARRQAAVRWASRLAGPLKPS